MENNKIRVTVSLFFKATGSKMGGGETLYCASKIDLNAENLIEFDLREYAQSQVEGLAELLEVPEENIEIVSRQKCEESTDND